MAVTGAIADAAKGEVPIMWDALLSSAVAGESLLQRHVDFVKRYLFDDVSVDEDALDPMVVDYAGKFLAVRICVPAKDLFGSESYQRTITGEATTNEIETFTDRARDIERTRMMLLAELARLLPIVAPLIPIISQRTSTSRPLLSSIDDEILTPAPDDFGRPYAPTQRTALGR